MRLHAELRRKQTEIQDENCIVTDIIELPESEYASLYQNLLRERDYLAERANMESFIDGQRCCVLVLGEGQEDGILVDSQGSSYARRSAFIPEARTLVRNHIRQLADYVVSEGIEHTEDGRWTNTYDELYYHYGANINDTNGNGKLLCKELQRRDEVNELIMTEDCIEVSYHLQYCENCRSDLADVMSVIGCNIYDEHDSHSTVKNSERVQSVYLSEFVDRMYNLTNQFVSDAIDKQVEGEYKISLAPIRNKVVNDSFSASLFMEMLSERPEIAEVDYDYENDTVSVALADEHIRFTDESGMRYLTEQDIEVMCAKHILWLNDEGGEQADFSNCVIRGMDLSRRNLNQAIFDGAKISNTQLYSAELCYASCVGTKFYNCYATDLTAEEANFKGAEFIGTELGRGIFTHSNFTDTRFRNCEVYSCSLDGSCIEGTDFGDTDTSLVRMNRCVYDEDIWNTDQNGSPITM